MNLFIVKKIILITVACSCFQAKAVSTDIPLINTNNQVADNRVEVSSFDMKLIYQPSPSMLKREKQGHINIYDGFTDKQVIKIMAQQFNRIENMMFTRVKMTDDSGKVKIDPETGSEIIAEDGCED